MNLKHFLLFTLLVLGFMSCGKDDEPTDTPATVSEANIVGTWNLSSISCNDGKLVTSVLGQESVSTFVVTGKDYNAKIVFSANPNTYVSSGSYTSVTKTTTLGTTETEETEDSFDDSGTWKVEGNKLIISAPGEPDQITEITKLEAKKLEYKISVESSFEDFGCPLSCPSTKSSDLVLVALVTSLVAPFAKLM